MQVILWPPYLHCDVFVCAGIHKHTIQSFIWELFEKVAYSTSLLGQL